MQLVGWYHSHPKFVSDPSPIDVQNHHVYQARAIVTNLPVYEYAYISVEDEAVSSAM